MRQRVKIISQQAGEHDIDFQEKVQNAIDKIQRSEFVDSLIKTNWFYSQTNSALTAVLEYEQREDLFDNVYSICVLFTQNLESVLLLNDNNDLKFPIIKNNIDQTSFSTASEFFLSKIGVNVMPGDWKLIGEMQKSGNIKQEIVAATYENPKNGRVDNWAEVNVKWMRVSELSNIASPKKLIATYGAYVLSQSEHDKIYHSIFKYSN